MTKARDISKLLSTANGKIAGEKLDVSFENITDTGTEGTRIATGTNAQRGTTAGQLRFNTDTGLTEYYTGTAFKVIDNPPTVSSIDVTEIDSQAGGNQSIVITGSNFQSGATVTFVGANGTDFNASTVTVDSETQITAVAPKASFLNAQEPYGVKVTNSSGLNGVIASQINVDSSPSWSTSSGTLATIQDNATGTHATVSANDPDGDTIVYSVQSGSIPAGTTLNSSSGTISGDPTDVTSATTNTFTIRATAGTKTVDRIFNIIVNPTLDGSTEAKANTSAEAIKTLTSTTTNGVYWIKPTGVSTAYQAYCNMNIGGGIILSAKIDSGSSSIWHWNSNLWTSNNNYNSSEYNVNSGHAKLQPAQDFPANYLYVTNDDMTRWCRFDLASETTGFHNIWSGNNTSFSVSGSTVGTHVSVANVETDHGTFSDARTDVTSSGARSTLLGYYTPNWQKNSTLGAKGFSSFGSDNHARLGRLVEVDVGPWESVHHEARGLGVRMGRWSGQNGGSYVDNSASRFQMIFLK